MLHTRVTVMVNIIGKVFEFWFWTEKSAKIAKNTSLQWQFKYPTNYLMNKDQLIKEVPRLLITSIKFAPS